MRAHTPISAALSAGVDAAFDLDATPGEYDALAELFLGDRAADSAPPLPLHSKPAKRDARETAIASPAAGSPDITPSQPLRPMAHEAQPASPTAAVEVEALVMGHLPVIASAWATQYAAAVAEYEHQPVAMLRLASGWASIELFGDTNSSASASPTTFEAALIEAAARSRRWILRVDAVDELVVVRSPQVRAVTLLCGADEAAVVAGYRTLKSISAPKAGEGLDAEFAPRAFRVAIMGAGGEQAAHAAAKLQEAFNAFLDRPLEAVAPVERIAPVRPNRLFQGVVGLASEAWMTRIADAASRPLEAASSQIRRPAPTTGATRESATDAQVTVRSHGAPDAAINSQIDAKTRFPSEHEALLSDVLLRAAPAAPRGPGAALSEMIPGMSLLPVRCPYDESVELATGPNGALEVLARAGDRSLEALTIVADWARMHHKLLTLACPALRMDAPGCPVRRLFTESAPAVRRLLDSDVRVHLLTRVSVSGADAWVCADLN